MRWSHIPPQDTKAFHSGVRQEPRHTGSRKTFTYCTNPYLNTHTVEMVVFVTVAVQELETFKSSLPLTPQAETQKFEATNNKVFTDLPL